MKPEAPQKLAFYLSLVVLSILYGYGATRIGWFPTNLLDRAVEQWHQLTAPPGFLASRVYDRQGTRILSLEETAPGLTFVGSTWEGPDGWKPGFMLIDTEGHLLHSWRIDPEALFKETGQRRELGLAQIDVAGSHLFPDGDVLFNLEYAGTARMDACSQVRWYLSEGGHHSIARAENGTFWIPGVSEHPILGTPDHPDSLPGVDHPVYHDYIRRISGDGEVRETIDVLDMLYENDLERHIIKGSHGLPEDVTHLNDIEPLSPGLAGEYPGFEAGDLVVSLRNLDLVLVLDPESGKVKWHASHPFLAQHDPDFIGEGWIGVFDNNWDGTGRGTILGGSRIVAVQPHTSAERVLYPTARSDSFYTPVRGTWEILENGNLLLVESAAGRVVEATPDGHTVWEWIVAPYDDEFVPFVTDATRVDLTPKQVASWPCSPGDSLDQGSRAPWGRALSRPVDSTRGRRSGADE